MAISIKRLKSSELNLPPRIIIHAVEGVGKTSLAAEFPNAVYVHTAGESTPMGISLPSPGQVNTYQDLADILGELATEEHDFKTLIIDTVDGLEPLIWAETCKRHGWNSIDDGSKETGYGKGYLAVDTVWRELTAGWDYLRENQHMTIILLAHSDRVTFEEPGIQPYKRYDLRIQKRAQAILCDWSDAILFVNPKVELKKTDAGFNKTNTHAEGGGMRWIYTDARPAFVAKNRAANMPSLIMYPKGKGYEQLAPHFFPAPQVAETPKQSTKKAA